MTRRDTAVAVARSLGPTGIRQRAAYELRKHVGMLPTDFSGVARSIDPRWQIDRAPVEAWWSAQSKADVDAAFDGGEQVVTGLIPVFGDQRPLGWPPTWRPDNTPAKWTGYSDFGTTDIKDIWEPSRWGFMGPLLRSDAATGRQDSQPRFLRAAESWIKANPPFRGENWMCGQESSLRAIAALHALGLFGGVSALDSDDQALVESLVAMTVERVRPTLGYAMSQRNNHAISEAGFLWTAAALLDRPKDEGSAARALERAISDQFAPDGSYAQCSFSYQRLALHTLLFVDLVCRTMGRNAPCALEPAFARSFELLAHLIDPDTGGLPNAGGNDGALLFRLTGCDITDYRPLVAHLAARLDRPKPFSNGPWDEEAAWFGHRPADVGPTRLGLHTTASYHVLRTEQTRVALRAGARSHRPAHADMLHVDISVGGKEIAVDPGTFRYTAEAPWANALADEEVHNVPRVSGLPQATRVGRFLWRDWSDAALTDAADAGDEQFLEAALEIGGTTFLRRVHLVGSIVTVTDECSAPGLVVRWNLPADVSVEDGRVTGHEFQATFDGGTLQRLRRACDEPRSGWSSPVYAALEPCAAIEITANRSRTIVSRFEVAEARR